MLFEVLDVVGMMEDEKRFVACASGGGGNPWSEPLVLPLLLFPLPEPLPEAIGGGEAIVPLQWPGFTRDLPFAVPFALGHELEDGRKLLVNPPKSEDDPPSVLADDIPNPEDEAPCVFLALPKGEPEPPVLVLLLALSSPAVELWRVNGWQTSS